MSDPTSSHTCDVSCDEAILGRIASGEIDALRDLYDRLGTAGYQVALIVLRSQPAACDVVETVFALIWRTRGQALSTNDARETLLDLIRNEAISYLHRHPNLVQTISDDDLCRTPANDSSRRPSSSLSDVPSLARRLLLLVGAAGLRLRDAATLAECSDEDARAALRDGLKQLSRAVPERSLCSRIDGAGGDRTVAARSGRSVSAQRTMVRPCPAEREENRR